MLKLILLLSSSNFFNFLFSFSFYSLSKKEETSENSLFYTFDLIFDVWFNHTLRLVSTTSDSDTSESYYLSLI